ncbi:hypothetical protein GLOTRDRAFT_112557 [Gloeophyllum trabeum ATCC 11539]|uniref:Uncharacterized protein n=1 Tax=Gloeophyllum trabeum (strain ATCC 11539 / FP-39264 / Madison 617) TaxID=670483 RepID=S7PUM4_GLOTA|nr:uncharacterized protein GLOTRDRAFT_112557 [Gloeophyllum trabeum ATCC 11539]EPQ51098.1 hypothetical protein GLOTRDRAFT_112557 [Gloeophyllum trabeum ATCC 11539]
MASNANAEASTSSSSAGSGTEEGPRAQAGPLPRKPGEIGYRAEESAGEGAQANRNSTPLPARHPADRDHAQESTTTSTSRGTPAPPLPSAPNGAPLSDNSSTHKSRRRHFFKPRRFGGLHASTLVLCVLQVLFLVGTIVGWVFAAMIVNKRARSDSDSSNAGSETSGSSGVFNAGIFIHVAFAVVTLSEVLFLERCVFRLRAERYMHVHPGAVLPRSMHLVRTSSASNSRLALAPWNRPPLPTYAAALAESGVGTGDVEDSAIAVAPPPAYGHNRGSMLLLSGYVSEDLRAQVRAGRRESWMTEERDRPVSYVSRDEEWEVVMDAERARRLEERLSRMDFGQSVARPASVHSRT